MGLQKQNHKKRRLQTGLGIGGVPATLQQTAIQNLVMASVQHTLVPILSTISAASEEPKGEKWEFFKRHMKRIFKNQKLYKNIATSTLSNSVLERLSHNMAANRQPNTNKRMGENEVGLINKKRQKL